MDSRTANTSLGRCNPSGRRPCKAANPGSWLRQDPGRANVRHINPLAVRRKVRLEIIKCGSDGRRHLGHRTAGGSQLHRLPDGGRRAIALAEDDVKRPGADRHSGRATNAHTGRIEHRHLSEAGSVNAHLNCVRRAGMREFEDLLAQRRGRSASAGEVDPKPVVGRRPAAADAGAEEWNADPHARLATAAQMTGDAEELAHIAADQIKRKWDGCR